MGNVIRNVKSNVISNVLPNVDPHGGFVDPYGPELLVDGDMEAVGVAAWTVGNSATLTKVPGQRLQIAYNGVANPYAYQTVLEFGIDYMISGEAYGDGTNAPALANGLGTIIWTGTSSTLKQDFAVSAQAAGAKFFRFLTLSSAGFSQWDNCSIKGIL